MDAEVSSTLRLESIVFIESLFGFYGTVNFLGYLMPNNIIPNNKFDL